MSERKVRLPAVTSVLGALTGLAEGSGAGEVPGVKEAVGDAAAVGLQAARASVSTNSSDTHLGEGATIASHSTANMGTPWPPSSTAPA